MRKIRYKLPLSVDHLEASLLFATQARELEQQRREPQLFHRKSELQAVSMACILSAVAYLEAAINEFFSNAAEEGVSDGVANGPHIIERLRQFWRLGTQRSSVLDKYDSALALCDLPVFVKGKAPYQDAALLIKLRNALTHFEPEWQPGGGPNEDAELARLSKSLRGRFSENSLAGGHQPFFPYRCLGYGSSKWAVMGSHSLVKEFRSRLGVGYSPTVILPALEKL